MGRLFFYWLKYGIKDGIVVYIEVIGVKKVRYISWILVTVGVMALALLYPLKAGTLQGETGEEFAETTEWTQEKVPEKTEQEQLPLVQEQTSADEPLPPTFVQVGTEYFQDALFIGDSRTVGLSTHGDLGEADVFADEGLTVYRLFQVKVQDEQGERMLEEVLQGRNYGKIYIMLGINELGYRMERTLEKYREVLETIRRLQPEALIFLQGNLHVTKEFSQKDQVFTNPKIDEINTAIAQMADGWTSFYLDINEVFDDAEGNLDVIYASDELHIQVKYYSLWVEWLRTKGILL